MIVDITTVTNGTETGTQQSSSIILDDDAPPTVTLSRNNSAINEAAGTVVFSAVLSAASSLPVTVNLGFTGTAMLNSDYTRTATQIVIAPGSKTGSVTVTAVQDALDESNETIVVDITTVINGTETGTQQSSSIIIDDDFAPTVTLTRNNAPINEAAGTSVFTATLSAASGLPVTVALGFTGTATFNSDYTSTGTQIVIPAGSTSGSITVTAVQDSRDEVDETVIFDITAVTNGTEATTQQATTTITDDDAPPIVTLSRNNASINEAAGTVVFTAYLSAASSFPVTVVFGFSGTATAATDYTSTATQIVIPAGATSGSITVTAIQDAIDEANETIIVDITSVTNGLESGIQQLTTTITNL